MKKKLLMTLAILACAALLVVGSVAGTLAYLRSMAFVSNTFNYGKVYISMTETAVASDGKAPDFSVARKDANTYLLMPDTTYVKDPVIHIDPSSQDTYLFVKVDNGIYGLGLTGSTDSTEEALTIHKQMLANGWKVYSTEGTAEKASVTYDNITNTPSDSGVAIWARSTVYYLSMGAGTTDAENAARIVKADYTHTLTQKITGVNQDGAYTYGNYVAGDVPTFSTFTTATTVVTQASMLAYINAGAKITVTAYAVQAEADDFDCYHDAASVFLAEWASAVPTPATPSN